MAFLREARKRSAADVPLKAPVEGVVKSVPVQAGKVVHEDDPLIVLTKGDTRIFVRAPRDGVLVAALSRTGEAVKEGQLLAVFRTAAMEKPVRAAQELAALYPSEKPDAEIPDCVDGLVEKTDQPTEIKSILSALDTFRRQGGPNGIRDPEVRDLVRCITGEMQACFAMAESCPELAPKVERFASVYLKNGIALIESYPQSERTGLSEAVQKAQADAKKTLAALARASKRLHGELIEWSAMDLSANAHALSRMLAMNGFAEHESKIQETPSGRGRETSYV